MITVAFRNLLSEKVRFSVSVLGVALSVLLITLFLSLFRGFSNTIDDYIESVPADLWVVQRGTRDFTGVSILPESLVETIRERAGSAVEEVSSLLSRPTEIIVNGAPVNSHLIGYDPTTGVGGPEVSEGKATAGPGEIIIDTVLARVAGISIGDSVTVGERELRVVGLSQGGNFVYTQLAFLPMEEARQVLGIEGVTNFILIRLRDPQQALTIKNAIEDVAPFLQVYLRQDFIDNTRGQLTNTLVPLLTVIVGVGLVVGTAVVGLTIYTLTVERVREYGILKAVGFTNWDLFRVVIQQSLTAGVLGFGVGMLFVLGASRLLDVWLPQFSTELKATDLAAVFGATIAMGAISSYVPIRRLARLDPVIVFNP